MIFNKLKRYGTDKILFIIPCKKYCSVYTTPINKMVHTCLKHFCSVKRE